MYEQLADLADIHYGKSPSAVLDIDGPFPIFGTGGIYGQSSAALFHGPAVIAARKGSLGAPHISHEPFWASDTTYAIIPKRETVPTWLYYQLCFFDLEKLNEATGVPSISRDYLARIRLFTPGPEHQEKIALILKTVDEAIEATGALIDKYEWVKTGMMQDLFTRGLTSDGKLRPSRDEAVDLYKATVVGWIPKNWDVKKLITTLAKIIDYRGVPPPKAESGIPLITARNVRFGYLDPEPAEYIAVSDFDRWMRRGLPQEGDVLFTTEAPLANVAQIPEYKVALGQRTITLQPAQEYVSRDFLKWLLMSDMAQSTIHRKESGSTAKGIQQKTFINLMFPFPDKPEQDAISEKLNAVESVIRAEKTKLKKLSQQKAGLMADLLTGKVPVTV